MSTSSRTRTVGDWFRDGEAWIVGLAGSRTPLRDSKGLAHLAVLLAQPGREVSALDLVGLVEGQRGRRGEAVDEGLSVGAPGDAGELLDAEAKAAYRTRLAEAQEELEEAERFHDPGRAERVRAEIEFIARELSAAVGLGGRDRRAASAIERARVNVTRAIKTTIERIAPHDEALAAHLRATVKTGAFCSYVPYPVEQVDWDFDGTRPPEAAGEPAPTLEAPQPAVDAPARAARAAPEPAPAPPQRMRSRAGRGLQEREGELAQLEEALELAARGSGDLLVIDGPAGIGKSALLAAAADTAAERGFTVLRARGSELERGFAFGIARQVFDGPLRAMDPGRRSELLRGAVRPAAAMLGYDEQDARLEGPAVPEMFAILNGLYWLTVGLANEAPLLVVVDDVHWADAASAAWLTFTAARAVDAPVLLILGARPLGADAASELADLVDSGDAGAIELAPLSERAVTAVVRATWPAAADVFCRACHAASEGNPFYLHELIAAARASGVTPDAAGAERLRDVTPESVIRYVGRRLRQLGPAARALGHACTVLGAKAELPAAASLADIGAEEALVAADALADVGILQGKQPLEFAHPLIRSAVDADVPLRTRTLMHERAVAILDEHGASASEIAAHVLHTRPAAQASVVRYLREAARQAVLHGSPRAAAELLERALIEPPEPAEMPEILLELAHARHDVGEREEAEECLMRALPLAGDPVQRAEIVLELSRPYDDVDFAARMQLLDGAIESVAELDPELRFRLEAKAVELLGEAALVSRSPQMRTAHMDRLARVAALAQGDMPVERQLRAFYTVHKAIAGEITAAEAKATVTQALDNGVLMQRLAGGAWSADSAVEVLSMVDAFDLADRHARDAERHARDQGAVIAQAWACLLRAANALQRGMLPAAEALLRSIDAITRQSPAPYVEDVANQVRAWVCVERDDLPGAAYACEALEQAGTAPLGIPWAKGRLYAARGEHDLAVTELKVAHDTLRAVGRWRGTLGSPRVDLVLSLAAVGEVAEARSVAAEELATARRFGAPSAVATALRALAHTASGAEALAHLAEAAAVLAPSQALLARAYVLHDLGAAQREAGDDRAGRENLRHALDLAIRCGALRIAERCRVELLAAGEEAVPLVPAGADLLTATERRAAELAAEGTPVLEIAQALFLSVPTVERQLATILEKLGVAEPSELAAALAA